MEDEDVGVVRGARRADGDVVVVVAVRVAHAGHAGADVDQVELRLDDCVRVRRAAAADASRATVVDERRADAGRPQVEGRADDDVVEAVGVDVARAVDAAAELGARLVRLQDRVGERRETAADARRPAVIDERQSLVALPRVVDVRAGDDVVVAVAVRVARSGHRDAEIGGSLIRLDERVCGRGRPVADAGRPAVKNEHRARVHDRRVVPSGADDDVVVAVVVDVARTGDARAEERADLVRLDDRVGVRRQPVADSGRASMKDEGHALVRLAQGVAAVSDDDVAVAVGVDVARARDHEVQGGRRVGLDDPVDRGGRAVGDAVGAAVEDQRRALLRSEIVPGGGDDHVGVAVAVDVARAGHAVAHEGARLIELQHAGAGDPVRRGRVGRCRRRQARADE